MESLRMRYLIVGQSSADTMHRLGQTLEASSRVGTAQEDLALWLGRMEKELASWDSQHGGQEPPVSTSDREKVGKKGARGTVTLRPHRAAREGSGGVQGWAVPGRGEVLP